MWRGGKGEEVKGRREEGEWRRGSGGGGVEEGEWRRGSGGGGVEEGEWRRGSEGGGEEMELSAACPNA